jgi:DNA-binding response OmpR family regulator
MFNLGIKQGGGVPKVLIAEDDPILAKMLQEWLVKEKYVVELASDGARAMDILFVGDFDAIIMDWDLPSKSGIEVITSYRASGGKAPVLMLTAKDQIQEKEIGFSAGSDDYLTKPFHPKEFELRLKALLRRSNAERSDTLGLGALSLDPAARRVTVGGQAIDLMPIEFRLLEFFLRHAGSVFSVEALMERVWTTDESCSVDSVRMCIARLRAHLKKHAGCPAITTVHGFGYRIEEVTIKS